jgi:hypothetical protein
LRIANFKLREGFTDYRTTRPQGTILAAKELKKLSAVDRNRIWWSGGVPQSIDAQARRAEVFFKRSEKKMRKQPY